jgi:dnd system-associated protein 4
MSALKIKIAKDKAELIKSLTTSENNNSPFPTYADVVVFAAALGAKRKKRSPLGQISKKDPGPINLDVFVTRGYDTAIKLLAIADTKDAKILGTLDQTMAEKRLEIFEEYANGGFEILRDELRGAVDYTEQIMLMLISERFKQEDGGQFSFDLSKFL